MRNIAIPSCDDVMMTSSPRQKVYQVWLKYHKEKWRLQKARRLERRQLASRQGPGGVARSRDLSSGGGGGGGTSSDITGFLWQQNRALVDKPWEIIQVRLAHT